MKSSSISASNSVILSLREWIITLALAVVICATLYYGWYSWERYEPGPNHRETCWAARQSDYWAYTRWMKYARERYKVLLIGDSVMWGQEVRNDATISHYINEHCGEEFIANMGNDGLFMAGINGIVTHYGDHLDNANIILQFNPLWMSNPRRDLHGPQKSNYHHPRLIPQMDLRINYYHDLNTRIGYMIDNRIRLFPFVRHIMANYYDNKSVAEWMINNPYRNPLAAITFQSPPVMAEKQGKGIPWTERNYKPFDDPFMDPSESIQFECFTSAIKKLQKKNSRVFVLLGPYNQYVHTPESRDALFAMMERVKEEFDKMGVPYFDTFAIGIESEMFGDYCHLLASGHDYVAKKLCEDARFRQWLDGVQ